MSWMTSYLPIGDWCCPTQKTMSWSGDYLTSMKGDYPNSATKTTANTNNTTAPTITANTPWNITRLTGG